MDSKLELQNNEFLRQFETSVNGQLARIEYAEQEKKIFLTKIIIPSKINSLEFEKLFIKSVLEYLSEKELSRLRAEIDSLKGRFKFLENSVVTSLVHIYIEEIPNPVSINDPSWNTRDIALDAIKALSSFGQFLVSVIVFIFVFTPVWILIAGLIYGTKKLRNRNK